jgi:hypothetical protein
MTTSRGWLWFAAFLVAFLAVFVAVESSFSPAFQDCVRGGENPYNSNPAEQHPPTFKPGSATALVECRGGYINAYGGALGALGTLIIAAFTCTLWIATSRQAELTREALVADQKAFIYANGIHPLWEVDKSTGQYNWRFRVGIKNSGATPTKNLRVYCDCEIRNSLLPTGHRFQDQPLKELSGFIAPKGDITTQVAPLDPLPAISPQDIIDVENNRKHIYIWGYMKYSDVFPGTKPHITRFRWQITLLGDPLTYDPTATGSPPVPGTMTFGYVHAAEGNCADEECND